MTRSALESRDRDPLRFLDRHIWHGYPSAVGAVGLKLLYSHILYRPSQLQPLFDAGSDLSILWLDRRNKVHMCLSRIVARQTNLYSADAEEPVPVMQPVTVDPDRFERSLKMLEAAQDRIAETLKGMRVLQIPYEEMVGQAADWNSAMCRFLGVEDLPLAHSTKKLAQGSLRERIANFDELTARLRGTRWESQLTDA